MFEEIMDTDLWASSLKTEENDDNSAVLVLLELNNVVSK